MKLNEILNNRNDVKELLIKLGYSNDEWYSISPDGVVRFGTDFYLGDHDMTFTEIPFQIGFMNGLLDLDNVGLTTLKGCPSEVKGYFSAIDNKLTSFEHAPSIIDGGVHIHRNNITSLVGVHNIFKRIDGVFSFDMHKITEGGLGLILIDGITSLSNAGGRVALQQFDIIEDYLGRPDDLFECQAELIENGFEEFAKL